MRPPRCWGAGEPCPLLDRCPPRRVRRVLDRLTCHVPAHRDDPASMRRSPPPTPVMAARSRPAAARAAPPPRRRARPDVRRSDRSRGTSETPVLHPPAAAQPGGAPTGHPHREVPPGRRSTGGIPPRRRGGMRRRPPQASRGSPALLRGPRQWRNATPSALPPGRCGSTPRHALPAGMAASPSPTPRSSRRTVPSAVSPPGSPPTSPTHARIAGARSTTPPPWPPRPVPPDRGPTRLRGPASAGSRGTVSPAPRRATRHGRAPICLPPGTSSLPASAVLPVVRGSCRAFRQRSFRSSGPPPVASLGAAACRCIPPIPARHRSAHRCMPPLPTPGGQATGGGFPEVVRACRWKGAASFEAQGLEQGCRGMRPVRTLQQGSPRNKRMS